MANRFFFKSIGIFPLAALALTMAASAQTAAGPKAAAKTKVPVRVKPWEQIKTPPLGEFKPQMPTRIQLENGLVIFLQEDHELPLIEGFARIRGGSREEPAEKTGLVQIYGQSWRTGGSKSRTGDQLDDLLASRGARVETSGGIDSTFMSWSALKEDFDATFAVMLELLREPEFRDEKIDLARNQLRTAISRRNDDASSIAGRESTKLAYGADNPYARTAEYYTVSAITRQDLLDWHKKSVHPNNMIIGVVGDFDSGQMEQKLRAAFGSWPKGPEVKPAQVQFRAPKPGYYLIEKDDVNQTNIRMVHLGIQRDNPDYYALEVMNEILGGGFSGRLLNSIRTKQGLAYSAGGGVGSTWDHPGIFRLTTGTKSETTVKAVKALLAELDRLAEDPGSEKELKRAKDSILNSFVFNFDSKDEIMAERMGYEFYGYPADFLERYQKAIEKVTAADVARVARKYVDKNKLAILVVGKKADFDAPLDTLGPVTKIDIALKETAEGGTKAAAAPAQSNAEGKALIAKVVEALGGKAKVQAIKSARSESSLQMRGPQGDIELKAESTVVYPDRLHQKLQTPMGEMLNVVTSQSGFRSMAGQTQDLPSANREENLRSLKRDLIPIAQHADDPSYAFAAGGTEKVGDVEARVLEITGDGIQLRWWVDPNSGRVLQSQFRGMGPQGPADNVTTYSEWKDFGGVTLPTKSVRTANGTPAGSITVVSFTPNPEVDPKIFEKP